MLKTTLLTFWGILLLNTQAFADNFENKYYFKAIAAINQNSNIKTIDSDINFILNHRAPIAPMLGFGIGYYIDESFRMDLTFENTNINFASKSGDFHFSEENIDHFGKRTIKRSANILSVMLNGYIDIIDEPTYKVFLGSGFGVGSSRIIEKRLDKFDSNIIINGNTIALPTIYSQNTNKNKKAFAYALILGTDFNINKGLNVELAYSWKHSGKMKVEDNANNVYEGHNLTLATRFNL